MSDLPVDPELENRFAAVEIEQMFVARGHAVAETLWLNELGFDPATFVWTAVFDLCSSLQLDEAGSTQMITKLVEGGVIDRTIERLTAETAA